MYFSRSDTAPQPHVEYPPEVNENTFLAVIWVGVGIATTFVALRGFIRVRYNGQFQLDDLFTLFAHMLLVALVVIYTVGHGDLFYEIRIAAGLLPPPSTEAGLQGLIDKADVTLKQSFASLICFWSCLWMVKASFLTFFYSLSDGLIWDRRLWYAVVAFVSLSYIAIVIDFTLTCGNPKNNFKSGACDSARNVQLQGLSLRMSTALDILTDVSILIIPWKILFIVQKSRKEKLAIGSVVSLGVFIIVFAIIRVVVTNAPNISPEPIWLEMWSAIESSVAVTVISLTSLKIFVARAAATSGYDSRVLSGQAPRSTGRSVGPGNQSGRVGWSREGAVPLDDMSHAGSDVQLRSDYYGEARKGSAGNDSDDVLVDK